MEFILRLFKNKKGEDKSKVYKNPNRYKVKFSKGRKLLDIIGDVDSLEEEFIKIYKVCLDEYKFKSSIKFKRYIRRYEFKEENNVDM